MADDMRAVRAIALSEAIKSGATDVLATAKSFLAFLNGDEDTQPEQEAKPAKVAKPTKAAKQEPKEEPEGPTKEQVGAAVEKLLASNKRKEAIALMGKYKATSVSSLDEKHYADFLEGAETILMAA